MTRHDLRRARAAVHAITRRRPWWVALGRGDAEGLTLGGVRRPWVTPVEAQAWQAWARGGGDARRAEAVLRAYPDAHWLLSLPQAFESGLIAGSPPATWIQPALHPNLARLRWILCWTWEPRGHYWRDAEDRQRWGVMPGFAPWAAVLTPGVPWNLAEWYAAGQSQSSQEILEVPWLYAVLGQTALLQAVGAGYWDWAASAR